MQFSASTFKAILGSLTFALVSSTALAQDKIARLPNGKPDLNGIWQTMGSAHWNLEPHMAEPSPVVAMGALGAIPGGLGVVEGGRIPYKPEALKKRDENKAKWLELDPLVQCKLPGVPRATYLPHPFQIVQEPNTMLFTYEFAGADRLVYFNRQGTEAPVDSWMGYNLARWEGDTLVIETSSQMEDTWLDSAGNFHGPTMKVTERYTPQGANVLMYEATITDPDTFTRPWKISMPIYRRLDKNMQLLDFKCIEFVEELLYGKYRKGVMK